MVQLRETLKGTSLACSSAELMAMQMASMMESDWVELTEADLDQLTGKEMSLVCQSGEPRATLKVILLG